MESCVTIEELRRRHWAHPFRPFTLRLADQRSFHIPSPEYLAQSRNGRVLYIAEPDGLEIVDLLMVVSMTMDQPKRNGQARRRRS